MAADATNQAFFLVMKLGVELIRYHQAA